MTIEPFYKVLYVGTADDGPVFVTVDWCSSDLNKRYTRLTFTGVIGPKANGDARGSCGQIELGYDEAPWLANGDLKRAELTRLIEVWRKWHLHDMQAGSPRQMAYLEAHPVKAVYPEPHYDRAREVLAAAGLDPDTEHLVDDEPYRYGHGWLRVEVPEDVLEWLAGLPETSRKYPWARHDDNYA